MFDDDEDEEDEENIITKNLQKSKDLHSKLNHLLEEKKAPITLVRSSTANIGSAATEKSNVSNMFSKKPTKKKLFDDDEEEEQPLQKTKTSILHEPLATIKEKPELKSSPFEKKRKPKYIETDENEIVPAKKILEPQPVAPVTVSNNRESNWSEKNDDEEVIDTKTRMERMQKMLQMRGNNSQEIASNRGSKAPEIKIEENRDSKVDELMNEKKVVTKKKPKKKIFIETIVEEKEDEKPKEDINFEAEKDDVTSTNTKAIKKEESKKLISGAFREEVPEKPKEEDKKEESNKKKLYDDEDDDFLFKKTTERKTDKNKKKFNFDDDD